MRILMRLEVNKIVSNQKAKRTHFMKMLLGVLAGVQYPPIHVSPIKGGYLVTKGVARLAVFKFVGLRLISALVTLPEEPYPYKDLQVGSHSAVPQPDGYSGPENPTAYPDL